MESIATTTGSRCALTALLVCCFAACGGGDERATAQWAPEGVTPTSVAEGNASERAAPRDPAMASSDERAPVVESVTFEPAKPVAGDVLRAVVEASDDRDAAPFLDYTWMLNGEVIAEGVPRIQLNEAQKGDRVELVVVANDGVNDSAAWSEMVLVHNAAPVVRKVDVEPKSDVVAGTPITLRPEARDRDGDDIDFVYSWKVNGRRQSERGAVFDTSELSRGDEVSVSVVAKDREGESEAFELPVFKLVNTPPLITSWPGAIKEDGVFEYAVEAEDPDGTRRLMFSLEEAPEGMQIDPESGVVHWEPKPDQLGSFSVAIIVDDLAGGKSKQVFELTTNLASDAASPAALDD